ncbi:MAG: NADH-quinone oxidoreductase subunit NuoE [Dethiobacter sp.]|jgi:NADH-quinone oxidoreductase subunit E|nr:NADH-quinone oxidoreductase subunit NuoE [Dethiobacter sp.]
MAGCACKSPEPKTIPYDEIAKIIQKYKGDSSAIIPILQDTQDLLGYIPKESISFMAKQLEVPPAKIYGIVTFYAQFRLNPIGKYNIMVCEGTACHVNGAKQIGNAITDDLGIGGGETTEDGLFTFEKVACVGCCSLSPVVVIEGETYPGLTPDKIRKVLKQYKDKEAQKQN